MNDAKKYYELAIQGCNNENGCSSAQTINSFQNMASVYAAEKNFDKANEFMTKAVGLCKATLNSNNPLYLSSLFLQAGVYTSLNKNKEAEELYTKVIDKYIERLNKDFAFMTEAERGDFVADLNAKLETYYAFVAYANLNDEVVVGNMFNYRLITKALLLNSQGDIKKQLARSKDEKVIQSYAELKKVANYLSRLYSFTNDDIVASGVNIDSLEVVRNGLEKKVSSVLAQSQLEKITWKDIQKKLGKDEVAIEIVRTEQVTVNGVSYGVLLVTKTDPKPFLFFMPNNDLEGVGVADYRKNVRTKEIDSVSFARFFEKIYHVTGPVKKIYISADGVYNKININTLINPKTGKYMLEDYDVCMLTNLKDMLKQDNKKDIIPSGNYAALFGYPDYGMALKPPTPFEDESLLALSRAGARGKWTLTELPGTKKEVEEIDRVLKTNSINTKLFLADRSDEGTVKKLDNPYILHIATHGFFESNLPKNNNTREVPEALKRAAENPLLRSGVMLAGASNSYSASYSEVASWEGYEDGILTAYEVMNLDLDSTELVVLSACQTGLGEVKNGEGVYGLQRAFLVAGAKAVIMSLWSVSDDATRDLMITFYDAWLKTGDKQLAFKEAQLEIKKKYKYPYYWGAFVLLER